MGGNIFRNQHRRWRKVSIYNIYQEFFFQVNCYFFSLSKPDSVPPFPKSKVEVLETIIIKTQPDTPENVYNEYFNNLNFDLNDVESIAEQNNQPELLSDNNNVHNVQQDIFYNDFSAGNILNLFLK